MRRCENVYRRRSIGWSAHFLPRRKIMSIVAIRRLLCKTISLTALIVLLHPGVARSQCFMRYAGDATSRRIRDIITVVSEAEQAIDTNHQTIGRWLLASSQSALTDVYGGLPAAEFQNRLSDTRWYIEKREMKKAAWSVKRAADELGNLSDVWNVGGAKAKMDELSALVEKGDSQAALARLQSLADLVRIDPLQRRLDHAAASLKVAREKHSKGCEMETVKAIDQAKDSLRRAYLGARLTQAKIILAHARLMLHDGKRCRAGWALRRGAGKIRKGSYLVDEAEADALAKIAAEIGEARAASRTNPGEASRKISEVEAKIVALLDAVRPAAVPAT